MRVAERSLILPAAPGHKDLATHLSAELSAFLGEAEVPVRLVVSRVDDAGYYCEVAVVEGARDSGPRKETILECRRRPSDASTFDVALIIPTGMGLDVGGHSGDATRVVRLLASTCDTLITHPNAVNAADINEIPSNCLYVEGSILARLLMGSVSLKRVRANRLLVVLDDLRGNSEKPREKLLTEAALNSVSAAQATLGVDCVRVVALRESLGMRSAYSPAGRAIGEIANLERVVEVLEEFSGEYDAVALSSVVNVDDAVIRAYYEGKLSNPWGGVEAMLTHAVALLFGLPAAHAPMLESVEQLYVDLGVVDPRMAAEAVTLTAFHCVLKGLHQSPQTCEGDACVRDSIHAGSIACLVTPDRCFGIPHIGAIEQGIPVVAVRDAGCVGEVDLSSFPFAALHYADNYLEAAGLLAALRAGISPRLLKHPIPHPEELLTER